MFTQFAPSQPLFETLNLIASGSGDPSMDVARSPPALNHRSGTFSGAAGIYQRHRYAKEIREAFELWSDRIEVLIKPQAAAA
jgi:hypothetical protein